MELESLYLRSMDDALMHRSMDDAPMHRPPQRDTHATIPIVVYVDESRGRGTQARGGR
jgi:hypothetical protein